MRAAMSNEGRSLRGLSMGRTRHCTHLICWRWRTNGVTILIVEPTARNCGLQASAGLND
jgi:hypothetical protein